MKHLAASRHATANNHFLRLVLCLLLFAAACAWRSPAYAQQKISFLSAEYANKFEMAKKQGKPIEIFGYLTMPTVPVSGKIPVVIIAHGSAGVQSKDTGFWAPYFNKLGFASFVVDSFAPRGVTSTVDDQSLVSNAADTADAFQALKFIAADPRFDAGRIGIIGFSRGGIAANETSTKSFRDNVLRDDKNLQFAFHIPVYAGCQNSRYRKNGSFDRTGAPMLFLMGGKDDYTPAKFCLDQIKGLQEEYPGVVDYRVYEGANHSFDGNQGAHYLQMGMSSRDCPMVETDIPSWSRRVVLTGQRLTPAEENQMYKDCVKRGVTVGSYDNKYRDMAARDVEDFLRKIRMID
ncbi:dienelactone hydrolase-like enzyme [Herbaspirillum sp. CF444]|uniref:dienelactone hydrolase family protein n=1 Tax=Herbaspirillum sp. CF444 TaxID=1144319 RepID=UPI000272794F|nr:dienelactone hydrolase family protein [Herbaspirillum sp. CF444]EJL87940.1 dienelactone hydrolase-like enzyme [Herbaspirillum sp. CF444]